MSEGNFVFGPAGKQVKWSARPGQDSGKFYPVLSPKPGMTIHVLITGERVVGVYMHYIAGRHAPCLGDRASCYGCSNGLGWRWKGFVECVQVGNGKQSILEVTRNAWDTTPQLQLEDGSLRGLYAHVRRRGRDQNSPVVVEITKRAPAPTVPPGFDLKEALMRIWGLNKREIPEHELGTDQTE